MLQSSSGPRRARSVLVEGSRFLAPYHPCGRRHNLRSRLIFGQFLKRQTPSCGKPLPQLGWQAQALLLPRLVYEAHFHFFGVGFCGGFPLVLNCASLPDGQDFFARALRSIESATTRGGIRVSGRRQPAVSHPSAPSSQLSPIATKALRAPVGPEGGRKVMRKQLQVWLPILLVCFATVAASAQSFRVQCPTSTITHPSALHNNDSSPHTAGRRPLRPSAGGYLMPASHVNGAIKCQQISGGDGYATMGDGTQTYMFSFGPLSGLADIALGSRARSSRASSIPYIGPATPLQPGDPATTGVRLHLQRRRRAGLPTRIRAARDIPNRRTRGSPPDHGCRRDERQHPGALDGDRRGRRVLPHADQRRA